jgi:hypothetical protein
VLGSESFGLFLKAMAIGVREMPPTRLAIVGVSEGRGREHARQDQHRPVADGQRCRVANDESRERNKPRQTTDGLETPRIMWPLKCIATLSYFFQGSTMIQRRIWS